jgi:hypothetical protein
MWSRKSLIMIATIAAIAVVGFLGQAGKRVEGKLHCVRFCVCCRFSELFGLSRDF